MTLKQLSQEYSSTIGHHRTYLEVGFIGGANTIIDMVTNLIHQLREEGKDLWAASEILEKFEELKGGEHDTREKGT